MVRSVSVCGPFNGPCVVRSMVVLTSVVCSFVFSLLHVLGFFMEPTIFTGVEDHMMVAKEESFGPVMIISTFEDG